MSDEGQRGCSGVAGERVLEGGEVSVLEHLEDLVAEGSVNVATFVVLSTLFSMLAEERVLVEGSCLLWDAGCATWVGRADEGVFGDKGILCCREDDPEAAVLSPTAGNLDRSRVGGEETVDVSN